MTSQALRAMRTELAKIATVPGPVKMYRRAFEALSDGKHNFHGTKPEYVDPILSAGALQPYKGTYGTGAYMWKDRPELSYMREPDASGVIMARSELGALRPPADAPPMVSPQVRSLMDISRDPVPIPAQSMLSAPPDVLHNAQGLMKERRVRPIDSAIFHRAEGDVRMGQFSSPDVKTPSKKVLIDIHARKTEPLAIKRLRGKRNEAEEDEFLDSYMAATGQ